jgi:hypothetical protein
MKELLRCFHFFGHSHVRMQNPGFAAPYKNESDPGTGTVLCGPILALFFETDPKPPEIKKFYRDNLLKI